MEQRAPRTPLSPIALGPPPGRLRIRVARLPGGGPGGPLGRQAGAPSPRGEGRCPLHIHAAHCGSARHSHAAHGVHLLAVCRAPHLCSADRLAALHRAGCAVERLMKRAPQQRAAPSLCSASATLRSTAERSLCAAPQAPMALCARPTSRRGAGGSPSGATACQWGDRWGLVERASAISGVCITAARLTDPTGKPERNREQPNGGCAGGAYYRYPPLGDGHNREKPKGGGGGGGEEAARRAARFSGGHGRRRGGALRSGGSASSHGAGAAPPPPPRKKAAGPGV